MTTLKGIRRFTPQDRLFTLVEYICVHLDMETYAVSAAKNVVIRQPGNHFSTLISKQFPIHVRHSVYGPFWASFQPTKMVAYEFNFVPASKPKDNLIHFHSDTWGSVAEMFWNMALVFFYEQNLPWINRTFGSSSKDRDGWPAIFRFAWALRNAAVHHNGKLNITDPNVPPIVWHHLRYDHNDVGLKVFGDVLTLADMLIFLVEMSDELDRLGAPHP
jgi:hypothetical protein